MYQKAFEQYLRRGTPIEISLKMLTARTETRDNHSTALYRWRTAGDNKVRASHAANNGKIFAWDNPNRTFKRAFTLLPRGPAEWGDIELKICIL